MMMMILLLLLLLALLSLPLLTIKGLLDLFLLER
jgi:hypothetical protein